MKPKKVQCALCYHERPREIKSCPSPACIKRRQWIKAAHMGDRFWAERDATPERESRIQLYEARAALLLPLFPEDES